MAASTKLDLVLSRVSTECGSLISKIESKDVSPYVRLAGLSYYTAVPIQKLWKSLTTFGTTTIDLSVPTSQFFGASSNLYYFLGINRSDFLLAGHEFRDNVGYGFSMTLAGQDGRNAPFNQNILGGFPPSVLPDLNYATNMDFYVADEHFEYDEINNLLMVTTPGEGSVTIGLCYGYDGDVDDEDLDPSLGVSWNHIDLFGRMVALEFLKDFVASRGLVSMQALDFTLDTDMIGAKVDKLQDQIDTELPQISTAFMMLK